jgi:hypothetical protein
LNDGQIQNSSNPFGIVPLSNFVPRGFGFVHHSIAILYHEVPNPNLTIRNFFIAVARSCCAACWRRLHPPPPPLRSVEAAGAAAEGAVVIDTVRGARRRGVRKQPPRVCSPHLS